MKKTIATLSALACLAFASSATAASGDGFGFAEVVDPDSGTSAPAFAPAQTAWWAGVCDLHARDFSGPGAIGFDPSTHFSNCIEHPAAFIDAAGGESSQIQPPLAPGVVPGTGNASQGIVGTGPDGWIRNKTLSEGPAWRLADATQAGAHPDGSASVWFSRDPNFREGAAANYTKGGPDGHPRDLRVSLPPGVVGNPNAIPQCPSEAINTVPTTCPPQSQVGVVTVSYNGITGISPVYNAEPRDGKAGELVISGTAIATSYATNTAVFADVRTDSDFGVDFAVDDLPAAVSLHGQTFTVWAVPWAKSHDRYRPVAGYCHQESPKSPFGDNSWMGGGNLTLQGLAGGQSKGCDQNPVPYHPSWGPIKPFFATQTECPANAVTKIEATNYHSSVIAKADSFVPDITGCEDLSFPADISLDPTTAMADSPTGLDVELAIPQNNEPPAEVASDPDDDTGAPAFWKSKEGLAVSHLKDTVVTLPEGFSINPAAANGQGVCTTQQIGLTSPIGATPITFNEEDPYDGKGAECPESAKIAEVLVETPLLEESDWPEGNVYLAAQNDNPFASNYALYIVLRSPKRGIVIKLAGKVEPDPVTGRLKTTVVDNPQLPFDVFRLSFKGGPQAPLATSPVCGPAQMHTTLSPYSDPGNPVLVNQEVEVSQSPTGGACATSRSARPFNLGFSAGSTKLIAGAPSPFTVRVQRPDGAQELDRISVTTPEGLVAKLAGVPYCPEAGIAAAIARTAVGDGVLEKQSPSCPASSQVGTTTIGAGAGISPVYVGGKVYLAGPYKGAPLSLAFIVPAVAGPFDLGVQVVRTALNVNPKTAQVTAVSDEIPKILAGVPLRIRDVRVDIDRDGFTQNPTDCSEQHVTGVINGASGAVANVDNRFQVAECAQLGFKPHLKIELFGGTKRGDYQRLRATVTARPGDANIARTAVTLPHSEFLAQEHIRTVCTRVQFAADACPAGSIYGKASAISPLLDQPLSGPVYLRSSDNLLPDLVAALRGPDHQPIEIELSGRTDSKNEGIRNTFDVVPDAPVTKFTLEMMGAKKSLIVNSTNICQGIHRADVRMDAQNGRSHDFTPKVSNPKCGKSKKGKKSKGTKAKAPKRTVASRTLAEIAGGLF